MKNQIKPGDILDLPACTLRIDGNTYAHRAALRAAGWVWERGFSSWTKKHIGKLRARAGCRVVADGSTVVYDLDYVAPGTTASSNTRENFDNFDR